MRLCGLGTISTPSVPHAYSSELHHGDPQSPGCTAEAGTSCQGGPSSPWTSSKQQKAPSILNQAPGPPIFSLPANTWCRPLLAPAARLPRPSLGLLPGLPASTRIISDPCLTGHQRSLPKMQASCRDLGDNLGSGTAREPALYPQRPLGSGSTSLGHTHHRTLSGHTE